MQLQLVGPRGRFPRARLVDPPSSGYLHLAAAVDPPVGPTPFVRTSQKKRRLLDHLGPLVREVRGQAEVRRVTVYKALVMPPPRGYARREGVHHPRFDMVVLVETGSPDAVAAVQAGMPYQRMHAALAESARDLHVMAARCGRSLGDVDRERPGLFLFNYFVAEDPALARELWEMLAGWYAVQTGMDNSVLLEPLDSSDYVFVNHARWDSSLPRFLLRQVTKPSFRSYVLANLLVNRTGSMPVLYHLA